MATVPDRAGRDGGGRDDAGRATGWTGARHTKQAIKRTQSLTECAQSFTEKQNGASRKPASARSANQVLGVIWHSVKLCVRLIALPQTHIPAGIHAL